MSSLDEELACARACLEILRIRMGERVQLEIQGPENLRATPMPPMMLQTLVENAIKHGLAPLLRAELLSLLRESSPDLEVVDECEDGGSALDAFDRGAIDYLPKPVSRERLAATIKRVKSRASSGRADAGALIALPGKARCGA